MWYDKMNVVCLPALALDGVLLSGSAIFGLLARAPCPLQMQQQYETPFLYTFRFINLYKDY